MIHAIQAGKREKSAQIMVRTDCSSVMVTTVSPVRMSVSETNPATPKRKAMRLAEIAPPNFCAIVPEEKISPVEELPYVSVA